MQKHRKRKVIKQTQPKKVETNHFKCNYHSYLTLATVLLASSAILFGLEETEIPLRVFTASGTGVLGAIIMLIITW